MGIGPRSQQHQCEESGTPVKTKKSKNRSRLFKITIELGELVSPDFPGEFLTLNDLRYAIDYAIDDILDSNTNMYKVCRSVRLIYDNKRGISR
jgi:hypothetical protein